MLPIPQPAFPLAKEQWVANAVLLATLCLNLEASVFTPAELLGEQVCFSRLFFPRKSPLQEAEGKVKWRDRL